MRYGRGDGDWTELYGLATQQHTAGTQSAFCGTPRLAGDRMEGAEAFGLDCTDFLEGHA